MRDVLEHLCRPDGDLFRLTRWGLEGLTDAEYLWEPAEYAWSVRHRDELRTPLPPCAPDGEWAFEVAYPEPEPSPFTTIAWRLVHMTGWIRAGTAILRRAGGGGRSADASPVPGTADEAVAQWDNAVDALWAAIGNANDGDLCRDQPRRDAADVVSPVWQQVLRAVLEPAAHGAEIRLIRDLYRHTVGGTIPLRPAAS